VTHPFLAAPAGDPAHRSRHRIAASAAMRGAPASWLENENTGLEDRRWQFGKTC